MGREHPNIAQFITEILKDEENDIFYLKRAIKGKFEQTTKDLVKEDKLRVCVKNYEFYNTIDYLEALIFKL
jgi:hypothetical protein